MGYTHYFRDLELNDGLVEDARRIVAATDIKICDGHGEGSPRITQDMIWLNGDASANDESETFVLYRDHEPEFNFCKTGRKPYDEVVVAILIAAMANEAPGYESINSDGSVFEWFGGIALYEKACRQLTDALAQKIANRIRIPQNGLLEISVYCREDLFRSSWLYDIKTELDFSMYNMCRSVNMNKRSLDMSLQDYWNYLGLGKITFDPAAVIVDKKSACEARETARSLHMIWVNYAAKIKDELMELPNRSGKAVFRKRMDYVSAKTNIASAVDALVNGVPVDDIIAG